ncbi:unnamed protein product, partial [Heterosigma akashiwo]
KQEGASPGSEWRSFDPKELGPGATYSLGISAIVPRPIALITTVSSLPEKGDDTDGGAGILNCAPFSYTGLLSHDPPIVCHGICLANGQKKDTLVNIEETGQWVFNLISDSWLAKANSCAEAFSSDVDEIQEAGLTAIPSDNVQVPRLEEAKVSLECRLDSKREVFNDDGKHTTTVVFGRVVKFHVHESVLTERNGDPGRPLVDLKKMRFCGRAGDITYWPAGEGQATPMERP